MDSSSNIDQLVIALVAGSQAGELMKRLLQEGFHFTQIDSSGGFLQEPTICMLIGLHHSRHAKLMELIRKYCHTRRQFIPARVDVPQLQVQPIMIEAQVGGATIFTVNVELFEQL
jgi:uncharacterized protein YaaQ